MPPPRRLRPDVERRQAVAEAALDLVAEGPTWWSPAAATMAATVVASG